MNTFEKHESNVRSYCRIFPDIFHTAKDSFIYTEEGKKYIDFFTAAGSLNYGHNNDFIKDYLIKYIESNGISQGLDMYTVAKREFIDNFTSSILKPKNFDYKLQFCGSTGTNAIEAAIKLARKVKNRTTIFSFMGAFHGMSLGSLSLTGNLESRAGAGIPLNNVVFMPFPNSFISSFNTIEYINAILSDPNSGVEKPAAIILETVQAEGGINIAPVDWLRKLYKLCKIHDILIICDEIQIGCNRTGTFFSFERAGIDPDIIALSKSISGYGLPMSLLLIKPELDIWKPGEHNGTFRGNQLAFVCATAALKYREQYNLESLVESKSRYLYSFLTKTLVGVNNNIEIRGIGMIWGIDFTNAGGADMAKKVSARCYELGLIIELAGRNNTVLKLMPPLTIDMGTLQEGCTILLQAMRECINL
jgi:diaminobutyrate-2-oxoglutarate transaminase